MNVKKILKDLEALGMKQEAIAQAIGTTQATVSRWYTGSDPRGSNRDALFQLAVNQGVVKNDRIGSATNVPLMGKVGAGQAIYPINDGGQEEIEAPEGVAKGTVAIEVEGDSMLPYYPAGSILFYSKLLPPMERINKRSVVQLADGRLLLKQLVKGSAEGFFTLLSTNAEPIDDVAVEWVAKIDWIKPRD